MNSSSSKPFPNTAQSFGITGFSLLVMLLLIPLMFSLNESIGEAPSMLIYYCTALVIPIIIFHFLKRKYEKKVSYQLLPKSRFLFFALIVITIAIQNAILTPITSFIPVPESIKDIFYKFMLQSKNPYGFITIALAAPILEEWLFRGIILDGLLKRYSAKKAILLSSFLFGILHLNPWQFVGAFILGIFIGYIYFHTKNLGYCILIHFSNNFVATIALFYFDESQVLQDDLYESYGGVINFYLIFSISLILVIALLYYIKKHFKSKSESYQFKNFNYPLNKISNW